MVTLVTFILASAIQTSLIALGSSKVAKLLATELFEGMKNAAPTGNKLRFQSQIPSFVRRPEKIVTFGLGFNEKNGGL